LYGRSYSLRLPTTYIYPVYILTPTKTTQIQHNKYTTQIYITTTTPIQHKYNTTQPITHNKNNTKNKSRSKDKDKKHNTTTPQHHNNNATIQQYNNATVNTHVDTTTDCTEIHVTPSGCHSIAIKLLEMTFCCSHWFHLVAKYEPDTPTYFLVCLSSRTFYNTPIYRIFIIFYLSPGHLSHFLHF